MSTITLKEVLKQMDAGVPFDMTVVACDKRRGTAGKLKVFSKVILTTKQPGQRGKTGSFDKLRMTSGGGSTPLTMTSGVPKSPNHYENSTRNLFDPKKRGSERICKIHLRLILKFNGATVI